MPVVTTPSPNSAKVQPEKPGIESNVHQLESVSPGNREEIRGEVLRRVSLPQPVEVRAGAALYEVLDGSKTVAPTPQGAPVDPLIKAVQKRLVAAGIMDTNGEPLEVDGKFGQRTAAAIATYRQREGLSPGRHIDSELMHRMIANEQEQRVASRATVAPDTERDRTAQALESASAVLSNLSSDQSKALTRKLETFGRQGGPVERNLVKAASGLGIDLSNEASIRDFQALRGIEVDGAIGPITARHISEVVSAEWLRRCVTMQDGSYEWRTGTNQLNVVGLRGWSPERGQNSNVSNLWNDTIAMVWMDESGLVRFKEFAATCDPGIRRNSKAPDVNGDGRGDVGHIAPGQYYFKHGYYKGMSGFGVPASGTDVHVYRDTNGDGKISYSDSQGPLRRGWERFRSFFGNDTFKFHGLRNGCDPDKLSSVGGASAGCQVPKITINEFKREISPLLKANPGTFPYTLIDLSTNKDHASALGRQFAQMRSERAANL